MVEYEETIGIVGAGLVGCLAALAFANKGFKVKVFESRPDLRAADQQLLSQLRSINLAVSSRGITALKSVDEEMAARVLKDLVPMHGRMVHDLQGNQVCQKYGLYGECINSINRALLNRSLLDEMDKLENIEIVFNTKLIKLDLKSLKPRAQFSSLASSDNLSVDDVDIWVGADGSYSAVRSYIQRFTPMNFSQEYIDHLYLELRIPARSSSKKSSSYFDSSCSQEPKLLSNSSDDVDSLRERFSLNPNHLHIWPRHEYMLIALANSDGSFTCTLFAPKKLFETGELNPDVDDSSVIAFFRTNFHDALDLMGEDLLLESFHNNPRGSLVCVKCSPYNVGGKAIIIGDAAHSMVPFYGQGMNCGFEDIRTLMNILEAHKFRNFDIAFDEYSRTRHKDLTAIVDLSMRNYIEMRHDVTSTAYLIRKSVDGLLSRFMGDLWLPLYTMVSFRADISYSRAVEDRRWQNDILTWVLRVALGGSILASAGFWHSRLLTGLAKITGR